MITRRQLRWVPNGFTVSRMLLAAAFALAGARGEWVLGFWLLVLALLTDFLDGWTALLLRAKTKLGARLDAYADAATVVGGIAGLAFGGQLAFWAAALLLLVGGLQSSEWFFWPKSGRGQAMRITAMVACLFVFWIYIAWMYAVQAFGWSWGYVPLTIGILGVLAVLKRHRIRAWTTPPTS